MADGWLRGERARIENGRISITGSLFEQAMVIGDNRPFLAVLAVLNPRRRPF